MKMIFCLLSLFSSISLAVPPTRLQPSGIPVLYRLSDLGSDNSTPYIDAFDFQVTGSGTENHDWKIPNNIYIVSTEALFSGQTAGDYIQASVIDIDNILGQGANTVLSTPINKFFITPSNSIKERIDLGYPSFALKDLYVRFSYTTTNALASVKARFNIIGHKAVQQ